MQSTPSPKYDSTPRGGSLKLIGTLVSQRVRGKEIFSFEYNEAWLSDNQSILYLDPNLGLYKGEGMK